MDIEESILCATMCSLCYTDIDDPEFLEKCSSLKFNKIYC